MLSAQAVSERLRSEESGFTLIEMLVAIGIGMIVMLAVLNLVDSSGRAGARVADKAETTQRTRMAMDRITRSLRTQACQSQASPPIITGYDSDLTFFSDTNTTTAFAPRKVQIYYSGGSIIQKTWVPTNTTAPFAYNATPSTTQTLATDITLVSGTPLFTYYGWRSPNSSPLATGLSTDTTSSPLPTNSIAQVVNISVTFKANAVSGRTSRGGSTTQTANVYTRNADFSGSSDAGRTWGPRCG